MQVFVLRSDLALVTVPVIAIYPEFPIIPRETHGLHVAVLSLPSAAIELVPDENTSVLVGDWRGLYVDQVVNDEARRRIDESFPEYMQRNALWAIQHNITRYGAAPGSWGVSAQDEYATAEQGWAYVDDVRTVADSMVASMPIDPTDDSNWPARIPVIYIPFE